MLDISTTQIITSVFSVITATSIAIIGYWIKTYISDSKRNFEKIFNKIDFLEGSFGKIEQSLGFLQGKSETLEKRQENQSMKMVELGQELNLLKELFKRHENLKNQ